MLSIVGPSLPPRRSSREAIHDAPAEACDNGYPWDEWRVDTAEDEGVLLQMDGPASIRAASAKLLQACQLVVDRWEHGDLAEAARDCQEAIAQATGHASLEPRNPIIIEVRGGVVQEVLSEPE
jgi:hypothetical protein